MHLNSSKKLLSTIISQKQWELVQKNQIIRKLFKCVDRTSSDLANISRNCIHWSFCLDFLLDFKIKAWELWLHAECRSSHLWQRLNHSGPETDLRECQLRIELFLLEWMTGTSAVVRSLPSHLLVTVWPQAGLIFLINDPISWQIRSLWQTEAFILRLVTSSEVTVGVEPSISISFPSVELFWIEDAFFCNLEKSVPLHSA